jgi:hypothetical protein
VLRRRTIPHQAALAAVHEIIEMPLAGQLDELAGDNPPSQHVARIGLNRA